ncbi:MAG: hypothetical protein AAFO01_20900 [Pseudomonadota bacterium]
MIFDGIRPGLALVMIGLFMGALSACDEQGSTEQVGETISEDAAGAEEVTEGASETTPESETAN